MCLKNGFIHTWKCLTKGGKYTDYFKIKSNKTKRSCCFCELYLIQYYIYSNKTNIPIFVRYIYCRSKSILKGTEKGNVFIYL